MIHHVGTGLFTGLPSPFRATRYHSLVIAPASVPAALEVMARSEDGEIMAVQHVDYPVYGVQFHPESVLTEHGYRLVDQFLHGVPPAPRALPLAADGVLVPQHPRRARSPLPAPGGSGPVIIETIVTTLDAAGAINFAPMGVEWGEERIVLKPFLETTTFRQPAAQTGAAVVNLTDDVDAVRAGRPSRARSSPGCRPRWCAAPCSRLPAPGGSWRFVTIDATPPRSRIETRVVHRGATGASSSASTAPGTPCSRPRSWLPAPTCFRRSRSARSSRGCR